MTERAQTKPLDRILDAVFGKCGTPEELALARAARPPRAIQITFNLSEGVAFALVLGTLLACQGLPPFFDRVIAPLWGLAPIALLIVLHQSRRQVEKHYERKARAALDPTT